MKSLRLAIGAAAVVLAGGAFAQTPPGVPYQVNTPFGPTTNHPFWFGPGPQTHNLNSYDWDNNNRAWFEWDGSGQVPGGIINNQLYKGNGGFFAFGYGFFNFPNNWSFSDVIQARTTINVRPYVYVDGYFGLIADVQGWGRADRLPIGSSEFYVLHNTPVYVRFYNFGSANWQGNTLGKAPVNPIGTIPMEYKATAYATFGIAGQNQFLQIGNPVFFSSLPGGVQPQFFYIDPVDSNFFAKVTIDRFATINYNVPAGVYQATGIVSVSSF